MKPYHLIVHVRRWEPPEVLGPFDWYELLDCVKRIHVLKEPPPMEVTRIL